MTGGLSPSTGDIKAKKNTFSFDIPRSQYWKCQADRFYFCHICFQNCTHDEIKSRFNSVNASYCSVQNLFFLFSA